MGAQIGPQFSMTWVEFSEVHCLGLIILLLLSPFTLTIKISVLNPKLKISSGGPSQCLAWRQSPLFILFGSHDKLCNLVLSVVSVIFFISIFVLFFKLIRIWFDNYNDGYARDPNWVNVLQGFSPPQKENKYCYQLVFTRCHTLVYMICTYHVS